MVEIQEQFIKKMKNTVVTMMLVKEDKNYMVMIDGMKVYESIEKYNALSEYWRLEERFMNPD